MSGFGKAKFGNSGGSKCPTWYIKGGENGAPGDNVYRILPPMHSLAEAGKWAIYVTTHWGYKGSDGNDPGRGRVKPFKCIEDKDRRTGMVRQACPECELFEQHNDSLKAKEARFTAEGKTEEEADTLLRPLKNWLREHSPDRKHHLAVMNKEGEFGHLKISHKTKKKLDAKIQELQADDVDPLDPEQGVWFNFRRVGAKIQADDIVEVVQANVEALVEGKKTVLKQNKKAPLTDEQCIQALAEVRDLAGVGGYILTHEQIQLLTTSGGDPDRVDEIFGMTQRSEKSASRKEQSAPPPSTKKEVGEPAAEPPKPKAPPLDPSDPAVKARLALIAAKEATRAKAQAEAEAKAEAEALAKARDSVPGLTAANDNGTQSDNPYEEDDAAFLARIGGSK